jgi:hypothetical protein
LLSRPQLEAETYFTTGRELGAYYWIGLEKQANMYYFQDGSQVNNGAVKNTSPCKRLPVFPLC